MRRYSLNVATHSRASIPQKPCICDKILKMPSLEDLTESDVSDRIKAAVVDLLRYCDTRLSGILALLNETPFCNHKVNEGRKR